jgi:hypothetical protein
MQSRCRQICVTHLYLARSIVVLYMYTGECKVLTTRCIVGVGSGAYFMLEIVQPQ